MAANLSDAESIFSAAIDLATPEECGAYVQSACGGNEALRQRVENLLQAHFHAGNFLEPPATTFRPASDPPIQEGPGTVIGSYKLLQQIGEGGMGVVFLAEQSRPVQRKVALKIIKPGMDTRQVIARFAAEQQALALMDHPNIARVFDAGATESGRPYFVMELVKGMPITDYCDQQRLTPQQRLDLFIPICHALQHAHQKGIIHRDLKPSNVMVALYDGRPVPKVIDFGVAKATGSKLTERTLFTEFGQVVGTLEYMSPEQAELNQLDVDTRSDIYSLGVLLYELLTGTTPFERKQLKAVAFLELLRVIREAEPPKPSTRLSTTEGLPSIAANRSLEPKKLSAMLRGDLDWIVMKALEKERSRRYETANALSRDLQRFLADEPVEASPPSTAHRVRKFVRRNKRTVAAATALVAALIAGVIGTSLGLLQAERKRAEAVAARDDADRAVQQTRRQLAAATLERALALCENGAFARGVLWLGRSLELAHEAGADDVEQDCRWNLAAMICHLDHLQFVLPHPDAVLAVALSADGQTVASGCKDGKLRLWKSATGEPLAGPLEHKSAVKVVAFHPHERLILAGCDDGTVTLWDLKTRNRRGPVLHHDGPVSSVAFSPDGESILTGSFDGTARLWKTGTGEMIGRPLDQENARCPSWTKGVVAAFSPDGRSVVTSGGDSGKVKFWDARTTEYKNRSFDAGSVVGSIAWRPKSNSILLGANKEGGLAAQMDAESGQQVGLSFVHMGSMESVAYSADGRTIVTGAGDRFVRLYDVATAQLLGKMLHQSTVESVAVSADGQTIVSGSDDATVRIWKRGHGNWIRTIGSGTATCAAAFSDDGRSVIFGDFNNGAKIWSVATGEIEQSFKSTAPDDWVEGVAFSPDGKTVFTQHSMLQVVKWWDRSTGKLLGSIPPQGDRLQQMALSPDGTTIFTRTDFTARLWNAATGQPIGSPLHFRDRVLGQAFHPDGKTVIISSADRTTRLWSAVSSDPLGPATSHSNEISALAYSPDGRMILAAEGFNSARLFDASSWRPLKAPLEHDATVRCVGFSPHGDVILTGCTDGTGRLWNAATCRPVGGGLPHEAPVNVITCSPDGKTVLTASNDGTAKLWRMPEPLRGSIEEVASSVHLSTGMRLDENDVENALDFEHWLAAQRKQSGKPDSTAVTPDQKLIGTFGDPAFDQWMRGVATLPADKQVEAVVRELRELNPDFDGTEAHRIESGVITELHFRTDYLADISPVRALAGLKKLNCSGGDSAKGVLFDLSPLKGMLLTALDCSRNQVSDLSPLKGMPLTDLNCVGTSVSDLSPLKGMLLTSLDCSRNQVSDLSPLKGMPMTFLNCGTTRVSDLSPLTGMKLTKLYCHDTNVSDLSPLHGMPLESLSCFSTPLSDLSPLMGMPLTTLDCHNTRLSDLSPLQGMRLTRLDCGQTNASDLLPLKGMPLANLACGTTLVSDLSPLKGMRLTLLHCGRTRVSDLSPIRGMPLSSLELHDTQVSDLLPLRGMNLREVWLTPKNITKGIEIIRQMKGLNNISIGWGDNRSFRRDEFWKKYDAGEFGKPDSAAATPGR